jgi:rhodanese-related sulfurtransferase
MSAAGDAAGGAADPQAGHEGSRIGEVLERARRRLPARPSAADLPALRARGALIVDIRPVEQRSRDGELPGAVVIDRNVLEWRLDPTSPHHIPEVSGPDQEIVIVCNEGFSSSLAALSLQELGLTRATDLDGGYQGVLALQR